MVEFAQSKGLVKLEQRLQILTEELNPYTSQLCCLQTHFRVLQSCLQMKAVLK